MCINNLYSISYYSHIYLPPILMGMAESQLPSHPKSQIPSQIPFKSSGRRRTKMPPFEPALRDESNGDIPILPRPLDAELIGKMSSNRRFSTFDTTPFDVSSNISASSGRRRMGIPPFDSSRFAGSNGSIFILLRPLDAELFDETSKWRSTECYKMTI